VGAHSDSVADGVVGRVAVRVGDVVVAGTDGLFEQLGRAVQMGTKLSFSPKNMADIIAGVAYKRSNESLVSKGKLYSSTLSQARSLSFVYAKFFILCVHKLHSVFRQKNLSILLLCPSRG
jgi:hypothetical protein